jgi:hypothetical protein
VAGVVKGVEADQVGVEQGAQDLLPAGEGAEDLRGREGGVQEQPYPGPVRASAEQRRQGQQVIVVDPDQVVLRGGDLDELKEEARRRGNEGERGGRNDGEVGEWKKKKEPSLSFSLFFCTLSANALFAFTYACHRSGSNRPAADGVSGSR